MKKWADVEDGSGQFKRVRIWDVLNFRASNDPETRRLWTERDYWSTHKNPSKKCKMHPSQALKVFRYNPSQAPKSSSGYKETLTHLFCKEVIQELGQLKVKVKERDYEFYFNSVEEEFDIESKIQNFRVDLFCTIERCSPTYFKSKWSGCVGIEIHVTNKTSSIKSLEMQVYNQMALIEIHIPSEMRFDDNREYTQQDEIKYLQDLKSYFMKHVKAEFISDPKSLEFENQMLKKDNEKLKRDNALKLEEISALQVRIRQYEEDLKKQSLRFKSLQSEHDFLKTNLNNIKHELSVERSKKIFKMIIEEIQMLFRTKD